MVSRSLQDGSAKRMNEDIRKRPADNCSQGPNGLPLGNWLWALLALVYGPPVCYIHCASLELSREPRDFQCILFKSCWAPYFSCTCLSTYHKLPVSMELHAHTCLCRNRCIAGKFTCTCVTMVRGGIPDFFFVGSLCLCGLWSP